MFLKDHLIDTFQKASLEKNKSILENVINIWAHRFGIETINELVVKNQNQINLIEDQEEENQDQINLIEDQEEENQNQINLTLFKNLQLQKEKDFKSKEEKITNNTEIVNKNINEAYKYDYKYIEKEELPLPNINNLRKWIKNEKKAS